MRPKLKNLKKNVAKLKWKRTSKFVKAKNCALEATNFYATQNRWESATDPEETRAFLGINYIMSISKLTNVKCYWSDDSYLSNDDMRKAMTRNRFMNILQNLHFTDNQTADKSEKAYKICMLY